MASINSICVFCSSSDSVDDTYKKAAIELGKKISANKQSLVYGGANVGLMGLIASTAGENGANVTGVIPESIKQVAYKECDELIYTTDLRERKAIMEQKSDAFIAMPGGFGTLEEVIEILTLKQLNFHSKPIVFLNINNFYQKLIELFETFFEERFAKESYQELYHFSPSVKDAFEYLSTYKPPEKITKWS